MTRALLALIALGLCSCATPRVAPRFDRPSTVPIQKAHKEAVVHVKSAQAKLDDLEKAHSELKLQIDSIKLDLDNALTSLNTSEGARVQLDAQLKDETIKANKLADAYDYAASNLFKVQASRHRWVKYAWYLAGLSVLEGLWIFRKPILMLVAGAGI